MSRRKDLPDDLACFLQQQKQRQARQETTMRSFPSRGDMDIEKLEARKKKNIHEDPVSHRIIEKRRRDRMNNCLADLSRLIPSSYLKKGRGRIEKTEIIEMAIKHIKHLQELLPSSGTSGSTGSTSGSGGPEVGSESATNSNMDESKSGS